jgi:hypothetical protein
VLVGRGWWLAIARGWWTYLCFFSGDRETTRLIDSSVPMPRFSYTLKCSDMMRWSPARHVPDTLHWCWRTARACSRYADEFLPNAWTVIAICNSLRQHHGTDRPSFACNLSRMPDPNTQYCAPSLWSIAYPDLWDFV